MGEVPQIQTVELTTQVPKPVWQTIEKGVPVISIQGQEVQEQVAVTTRAEQPVEVAVPEMHELKVHVANVQYAPREVLRQPKTTHVVVKEEVVPVELMRQKAQYVPQVQTIELIKEEPQQVIKQVQKSIPKYEMKYINNVITVGPKYMEHVHDVEEDVIESGTMAVEETWENARGVVQPAEPVVVQREAVSAFDRLDTNHDGVITRTEFAA